MGFVLRSELKFLDYEDFITGTPSIFFALVHSQTHTIYLSHLDILLHYAPELDVCTPIMFTKTSLIPPSEFRHQQL